VAHSGFGALQVISGINDITIKLWCSIIDGLLSWVKRWLFELEVPVVSNNTLSNIKILVVIKNFMVNSEVWNWVVNVIRELLVLVLVLSASSR
jgi:hypothetical protein